MVTSKLDGCRGRAPIFAREGAYVEGRGFPVGRSDGLLDAARLGNIEVFVSKVTKEACLGSVASGTRAPPRLSYKPVTSASRDRGNISHDPTHDLPCDPSTTHTPRDLLARDLGNL